MKILTKQYFPLFFLLIISLFWNFYYTGSHWLNEYGQQKGELWLLIECMVCIPLVCFYCYWPDIKTTLLKSVVYMSLIVLLGSYIIPAEQKNIWLQLENLRYVVIAAFVIFEVLIMLTVAIALKASLVTDKDPDDAIKEPLVKILGDSFITQLLTFEIRVWTYVLLKKKISVENFTGKHHFHGHLKDGTQSNLLGFIMIILFEMPIVHLLLHFIWSPFAANIITLLTFMSLLWFLAEYRAIAMRPVSLTAEKLIIRYGLFNPLTINLKDIKNMTINTESVGRNKGHKRFNSFGVPNIVIELHKSPSRSYDKIYLGLDQPQLFIKTYQNLNEIS